MTATKVVTTPMPPRRPPAQHMERPVEIVGHAGFFHHRRHDHEHRHGDQGETVEKSTVRLPTMNSAFQPNCVTARTTAIEPDTKASGTPSMQHAGHRQR